MSAKESLANFLSYVKLVAVVIVCGAVGYYFYTHRQQTKEAKEAKAPAAESTDAAGAEPIAVSTEPPVAGQKPSELLSPVMANNLPALLENFDEKPVELKSDFRVAEQTVAVQKMKPGNLQRAWTIADQLCREMEALQRERHVQASTILAQTQGAEEPQRAAPRSKAEMADRASRVEFFKRSAIQRWSIGQPRHRKKIEILYQQLLLAEAKR